jgi:hypothetical protein
VPTTRMRAGRSVAAVAAALLAVATYAPAARASADMATVLQDDAVLLHSLTPDIELALEKIRSLGVDRVRITANWSHIAPHADSATRPQFNAADPNNYPSGAWSALDRAVVLAHRHGLEIMIDIGFWAPRWAVSRYTPLSARQRYGISPGEFALFAQAVARRYSGSFVPASPDLSATFVPLFPQEPLPRAVAFTLWNEPNEGGFLLPQWTRSRGELVPASPHAYREMLYAAYPRIKAAAPSSQVLIGGTSPKGASAPSSTADPVPPLRFLRELACLNRDLKPLRSVGCAHFRPLPGDAYAHHPYSERFTPWQQDPAKDNVRMGDLDRLVRLLGQLHKLGRTNENLEIHITEYGYQTNPPDPTQAFDLNDQARFLPEAELIAWANPRVKSFAQFLIRDRPVRLGISPLVKWRDFQSGLQFANGTPKPAETAFHYGLVIRQTADGGLRFWGHVRGATRPTPVRITTPGAGGAWTVAPKLPASIETDKYGFFQAKGQADPADLYRPEVLVRGLWLPGIALKALRQP